MRGALTIVVLITTACTCPPRAVPVYGPSEAASGEPTVAPSTPATEAATTDAPSDGTEAPGHSAPVPSSPAPGQSQTCGDNDACSEGLECLHYFGIAGPRGPEFRTCEIRCKSTADCPSGQSCTTISDGPGQVCR